MKRSALRAVATIPFLSRARAQPSEAARGVTRSPPPWVERSETHHLSVHAIDGYRVRSTHPTCSPPVLDDAIMAPMVPQPGDVRKEISRSGDGFLTHVDSCRRSASGNVGLIIGDAPSCHSDAYRKRQRCHKKKHRRKLAHALAPLSALNFKERAWSAESENAVGLT